MANILVTGATGFIGKHLIRFLSMQDGITAWGISRSGGKVNDFKVDRVDLTSNDAFLSWRKGKPMFDAIFHLAAFLPSSFSSAEAETSFFPNLSVIRNVLSLAVSDKAAVIYASGSSVYGSGSNIPSHEDTLPQPDNWYTLSKYVGELICSVAHKQQGIITTSLRISAPFGPGQKAHNVINLFIKTALQSGDLILHGTGARAQDFIYVDDVVNALWLAYKKKISGVYHLGSGPIGCMRELAQVVISLVPGTKSKIVYSGKPDEQENYRGIFSIKRAQRDLGYIPKTSLVNGLLGCLATL